MKAYSLKTLVLHLAIAVTYLTVTSYLFVIDRDPNPIGTGLQQGLCFFLHLVITLFIMLTYLGRSTDKKGAGKKVLLHTAAIILVAALYTLFSSPVWEWLWSIR